MPRTLQLSSRLLALILLTTTTGALPAIAQKPAPTNPLAPAPQKEVEPSKTMGPAPQMTEADVSAFLDGLVPLQIERNDVAGVVVTVVKDGKVLFSKGYGYADREKKKPVSDSDTLFRVGSISKLFTWTAVMQLVQQGKIDLDRDVNEYLDFKIPQTFPQPITVRNLMTHTPGFEETVKELFVADAKDMAPLDAYLKTHIPARIFPAGKVGAYSNYGASLAGYIVQRVSGEKFEQYVENHIFKPLGMSHSSFVQPLPADLKPLMSEGYELGSGKAKEFEIVVPAPAGALATSGQDIARFMMAHLQNGSLNGQQILSPETTSQMHTRQFGLLPQLSGMCLGFYEESRNGHRIIGHGGDTMWFHSDLHLVLDQNLGFFISGNSAGKTEVSLRAAVWQKFLDRYYPYQPPAATPPASKADDAKSVAGSYLTSRRSETNFLYLFGLLGETKITANSDGTIETGGKDFNGQQKKYEEIAPLLYRKVDGQDMVGFLRDANGATTIAVDFPAIAFQSIPWYARKLFVTCVVVGTIAVFALTFIFWVVAGAVRWHYGRKLELPAGSYGIRRASRIACLFLLVAYGVWGGVLTYGSSDITRLTPALDPWLHLAQLLTILGIVAALLPIGDGLLTVGRPGWWWEKVWSIVVALACVGFIWLAIFGHLASWNVHY